MRHRTLFLFVLFGMICGLGPFNTAHALITWTGNIDPDDPADWDYYTDGYVGKSSDGTLTIAGETLESWCGTIGYDIGTTGEVSVIGSDSVWDNGDCIHVGSGGNGTLNITDGGTVYSYGGYLAGYYEMTGVVNVNGSGSRWNNYGRLYVGQLGHGALNIADGGIVVVDEETYVGSAPQATGTIHFGTGGGTFMCGSLLAPASELTGTGTIFTCGLVSDVDLVFDDTHGLTQTLTLNSEPDQDVTLYLDLSDGYDIYLGAGYRGNGSLTIKDGRTISSDHGYLGIHSGSTCIASVDGTGSTWTNSGDLHVGYDGNVTMSITNGGTVSNDDGLIGYASFSKSTVSVVGAGSTWTNEGSLSVGDYGHATLNIADGGLVSVADVLTIGYISSNWGVIKMSAGGMLALHGHADSSLVDFLDLIEGQGTIRYWDSPSFQWVDLLGATPGTDYTLTYITDPGSELLGYTLLTVLASGPWPVPGDANGDCIVNQTDARILALNWGESGGLAQGDFNDDGVVNAADASILAANWGYGLTESTSVPEPCMLVMLLGTAGLVLLRRRV